MPNDNSVPYREIPVGTHCFISLFEVSNSGSKLISNTPPTEVVRVDDRQCLGRVIKRNGELGKNVNGWKLHWFLNKADADEWYADQIAKTIHSLHLRRDAEVHAYQQQINRFEGMLQTLGRQS